MDTKFSVKRIDIDDLAFNGPRLEPRWDATVVFEVTSPFGDFELGVNVEQAETLDSAVVTATDAIAQWGSRFRECLPHATAS